MTGKKCASLSDQLSNVHGEIPGKKEESSGTVTTEPISVSTNGLSDLSIGSSRPSVSSIDGGSIDSSSSRKKKKKLIKVKASDLAKQGSPAAKGSRIPKPTIATTTKRRVDPATLEDMVDKWKATQQESKNGDSTVQSDPTSRKGQRLAIRGRVATRQGDEATRSDCAKPNQSARRSISRSRPKKDGESSSKKESPRRRSISRGRSRPAPSVVDDNSFVDFTGDGNNFFAPKKPSNRRSQSVGRASIRSSINSFTCDMSFTGEETDDLFNESTSSGFFVVKPIAGSEAEKDTANEFKAFQDCAPTAYGKRGEKPATKEGGALRRQRVKKEEGEPIPRQKPRRRQSCGPGTTKKKQETLEELVRTGLISKEQLAKLQAAGFQLVESGKKTASS